MLLAWKKAQRFEASTFLLMDSVCAPLPSVSESARQSAITAISSAIFLFLPVACSAVSACSMLSCALMIFSRRGLHHTIDRTTASLQGVKAPAPLGREFQHVYGLRLMRGDGRGKRPPAAAWYRCPYKSASTNTKHGRAVPV